MNNQNKMKLAVAKKAIEYIEQDMIVGVGTGSTANMFIEELAKIKTKVKKCIASSVATANRLQEHGFEVVELSEVFKIDLYVDGADEFDPYLNLIKGGGGALTREKIVLAVSDKFICIVDQTKETKILGKFPLPIEVIPMARSYIAREIIKRFGGEPVYRDGFVTDNGNQILDIHDLQISDPKQLEKNLNNIAGVVTNGLFANRGADIILCASHDKIEIINAK